MGVVGKSFAVVLFPLSILIILEALDIFTWQTPIDKVLVGAILMIALQIITLIMVRVYSGGLKMMNFVTAAVFIGTACLYIASKYMAFSFTDYVVVILAVMMFVEAMYALH